MGTPNAPFIAPSPGASPLQAMAPEAPSDSSRVSSWEPPKTWSSTWELRRLHGKIYRETVVEVEIQGETRSTSGLLHDRLLVAKPPILA